MATLFKTSLYEVSREFGGPEEGGWYHDRYTLIASAKADSQEAKELREDAKHVHELVAVNELVRGSLERRDVPVWQ